MMYLIDYVSDQRAMTGLIAYGAYVPYHRLARADIAATLGTGGGKGTRSVAGYDEDTTSMAVEAARSALGGHELPERVGQLFLATAAPAYLDKTNATALHAALALDEHVLALDMAGSVRSGAGALVTATRSACPPSRSCRTCGPDCRAEATRPPEGTVPPPSSSAATVPAARSSPNSSPTTR